MTHNRRERNRVPGWPYVHAAVDGHSCPVYVEVKEDERKDSAVAFLLAALRYSRRLGIQVRAVMTNNVRIFQSKRFPRVLR